MATELKPAGHRRSIAVRILRWTEVVCWILTASTGCYGFYLGFDTRDAGEDLVCQREGDGCGIIAGHAALCNACHRSRFDFIMILISFWMVIFGLVGLLAAFGAPFIRGECGFLRSRMGRGFFMFFIGTLGFAQGIDFTYIESLTLAVGCTDMAQGILLMLSYFCVGKGHQSQSVTKPSNTLAVTGSGPQIHAIQDSGSSSGSDSSSNAL
mmetsp:Transcript_38964/g.70334  ORF Transcript_38964/g.70334 Transcript_38964/m.70334 type:complete len:210 (+) Transcript_38964:56-685(+)